VAGRAAGDLRQLRAEVDRTLRTRRFFPRLLIDQGGGIEVVAATP
jgi:hypothetical protein